MEALILIIIAVTIIIIIAGTIIIYFLPKVSKKTGPSSTAAKSPSRKASAQTNSKFDSDPDWLRNRWKLAQAQQQAGLAGIFPEWYFDQITERQLNKLHELGISIKGKKITKGQASDLIGMHEPADEDTLQILTFFKVPTRGMNQTKARHEIALIFDDEVKAQAWKNRRPSQIQKEFFMFFAIKPEKGMTNTEASKLISNHESALAEKEDPQLDEWEAFQEIIDELSDRDFREDYQIKKPSITLIKNALASLQKEGKSYRDAADEIEAVIEKMLDLEPALRRG